MADELWKLIAIGPWCQTEVLKPYAGAWQADIERLENSIGEYQMAMLKWLDEEKTLRKRLEEAEKNFRSLGRLACCCGVITSEDHAEWNRLQAALATGVPGRARRRSDGHTHMGT